MCECVCAMSACVRVRECVRACGPQALFKTQVAADTLAAQVARLRRACRALVKSHAASGYADMVVQPDRTQGRRLGVYGIRSRTFGVRGVVTLTAAESERIHQALATTVARHSRAAMARLHAGALRVVSGPLNTRRAVPWHNKCMMPALP